MRLECLNADADVLVYYWSQRIEKKKIWHASNGFTLLTDIIYCLAFKFTQERIMVSTLEMYL